MLHTVLVILFCFVFSFSFSVSVPCARLSWPYRQLLNVRKYIVSYRISLYSFNFGKISYLITSN